MTFKAFPDTSICNSRYLRRQQFMQVSFSLFRTALVRFAIRIVLRSAKILNVFFKQLYSSCKFRKYYFGLKVLRAAWKITIKKSSRELLYCHVCGNAGSCRPEMYFLVSSSISKHFFANWKVNQAFYLKNIWHKKPLFSVQLQHLQRLQAL